MSFLTRIRATLPRRLPLLARGASRTALILGVGGIGGGVAAYGLLGAAGVSIRRPEQLPLSQRTHKYGSETDFARALGELRVALSNEGLVSTDEEERKAFATGPGGELPGAVGSHRAVVHVRSTDDVVRVVNISRKYRIPIVPYTGGTSLEGGISGSTYGTICIDLSGMDQILEINEVNADAVVQAGVSWNVLNATLEEKGISLFFPLDPGLGATIGGMIGTGCSGTNAMRYGTMRGEWVLNMTVVLPSGEVIKTRQRARKSSAGFDIGKLFIGAEGTLGIVTEVTIRLAPVLPTTVAVAQFPDVRQATEAVSEILNLGAQIQCIEFLESSFMKILAAAPAAARSTAPRPALDTLYIKIQGAPGPRMAASEDAQMRATSALVERIMRKHGARSYAFARDAAEADGLWAERRAALQFCVMEAQARGAQGYAMDVCVPVSRLPELVHMAKEEFQKAGLTAPILGHVGDGNFHAFVMHANEDEYARVKTTADRIVEKAIELEGTCTGEHGVGIRKKKYLERELGTGTVEMMRKIKDLFDPLGLFNPGKLYPDVDDTKSKKV